MWDGSFDLVSWGVWVFIVGGFGVIFPVFCTSVGSFQHVTERIYRRHRVSFRNMWLFWLIGIAVLSFSALNATEISDWRMAAGIGGILIGMLLVAHSVGNLPTYLRVISTPTRHISDIKPGRVSVEGTVESTEQITAPLSGTDAVAYQISIQSSPDGDNWNQELFVDERRPFMLRDYTGQVQIETAGADFRFSHEAAFSGNGTVDDDLPDRVTEYVSSLSGVTPGDTEIRYTEQLLEPETETYVIGQAHRGTDTAELTIGEGSTFMIKPGTEASVNQAFRQVVVGNATLGIGLVCCGLLLHHWPI